jgi:uncharacterized oligopeptide transporter (OPT) family protein
MASVAQGVFLGGLPWGIIGIGAGIAVVVIVIDVMLEKRQARFRMPVMAFAVGAYLPFELTTPIFLGGLAAYFVDRALARASADEERRNVAGRQGLLFSAGLITGEALMGIALAIPIAATHSDTVLALFGGRFADLRIPGLILVAAVLTLAYYAALSPEKKPPPYEDRWK